MPFIALDICLQTRLWSPGKDWSRVKVGVIQAFPRRHPRGLVEDVVVPADAEGKGGQLSSCLDRAGRRPKQAKSQSGPASNSSCRCQVGQ